MKPIGKSLFAAVSLAALLALGWWAIDRPPAPEEATRADQIDREWLTEMQASAQLLSDSVLAGGNINAALAMLDAIESRIVRHPAKEKLVAVRVAIATDRQRLIALRAVDLQQAAAQIEAIILDIDSLPLITSAAAIAPIDSDRAASASAGLSVMQSTIEAIQSRLAGMVRIRRVENPEAIFLSPEQGALVTERLRLRLLSARIALVARQDKIFAQDIGQAEKILAEVFESQNSRVMAHRKTLAAIKGLIEKIPLPTSLALTEALSAVRPSGEGPASTTP
jgi:uroporphyrin-3 C-methyltransferase